MSSVEVNQYNDGKDKGNPKNVSMSVSWNDCDAVYLQYGDDYGDSRRRGGFCAAGVAVLCAGSSGNQMDSGSLLEVCSGWRCSNVKRLASPPYMVGAMYVSMYVIHGSTVVVRWSGGGPHSIVVQ